MRFPALLLLLLLPTAVWAQPVHHGLPPDARPALLTFLRALFPELRASSSTTYYVAPGGSDSAPCSQSAPCKTLAAAIARMVGGDTLYLRAGTYAEHIGYPVNPFPPGGTAERPTTIAGYPGERAILAPTGVSNVIAFLSGPEQNLYHHIVFDRLVFDGRGVSDTPVSLGYNDALTLTNSEVYGARGANIMGAGSFCTFRNLYVHDAQGYGWYWSGRDSLFEGNRVERNGGYGMHIYSSVPDKDQVHRNVVRGNTFRGNGKNFVHSGTGARQYLSAVLLASGSGHTVVNNLIVDNYSGVQVDYSGGQTTPHQVLANTITGNQADGVIVGQAAGTVVQGNILWGNGGVPVTDRGTGTVQAHNLTSDPRFVSASDFHLQAGSPAIDTGVALPAAPTDLEGTARPQGAGYDLGAYEYVPPTPVPPEPPAGALRVTCEGILGRDAGALALLCARQPGTR